MSNSTPASVARRFARAQRYALATVLDSEQERRIRIALSRDGYVIFGQDAFPHVQTHDLIRLYVGTQRCFIVIEGSVALRADHDDVCRWSAVHPGKALGGRIEPAVVVWSCFDQGPHALTRDDWIISPSPKLRDERSLMEHLNAHHGSLIEALVWQLTALDGRSARVLSIDPEGLLIEASSELAYLAFDSTCETPRAMNDALLRMARSLSGAEARPARMADALRYGHTLSAADRTKRSGQSGPSLNAPIEYGASRPGRT